MQRKNVSLSRNLPFENGTKISGKKTVTIRRLQKFPTRVLQHSSICTLSFKDEHFIWRLLPLGRIFKLTLWATVFSDCKSNMDRIAIGRAVVLALVAKDWTTVASSNPAPSWAFQKYNIGKIQWLLWWHLKLWKEKNLSGEFSSVSWASNLTKYKTIFLRVRSKKWPSSDQRECNLSSNV